MKKIFRKAIVLVLTVALMCSSLQSISLNLTAYAVEGTTALSDSELAAAYSATSVNRVSVHDPSVVYDGNGTYYIFGSHLAWAKSTDLKNWTTFTNNINTDYATLFASNFTWAAMGDSVYAPSGNMWAPDVIYNDILGKWCMYMSINGCSWNSSIAMLTADSLDGNWTYAGTVIYSGFTNAAYNHDFTYTDYDEVTGDTTLPSRYIQSAYTCKDGTTTTAATTWNTSTGAHAIDPCVFYGQNGKLYMTYGSWSGGIYIIELNKATGLRDTSATYNYTANTSDPYMGIKLAGGYQTSGEASYIEYIDGYYYMFVTNGSLVANGGYNMRVYRSANPAGPYTDVSGQSPMYTTGTSNTNSDVGTRLMSYYKWSYQEFAQVAQGHNSAIVSPDGKAFLVYHTRTNNGTEVHSVRVHQLFTTENHYLVAAPFEYNGETVSQTGYSSSEVVGSYEVILQKQSIDYTNLEYCAGSEMTLNSDGTITGAYTGTWTMVNGKPYCNLVIGGVAYEGLFVEQTMEETNINTMCFTAVGTNDVCIWGAKYPSAAAAIAMTSSNLSVVSDAYTSMNLPTTGLYGTSISWSSSDTSVIADNGTVTAPSTDTNVTLTALISRDNYTYQKTYTVLVHGAITDYSQIQLLASAFVGNPQDLSTRMDGSLSMPNPYLSNTEIDYSRGVKIKFDVQSTGVNRVLATILSFMGSGGANGRLYFTPGSYLGYNATGGYFDANLYSYGMVTDYIGTEKTTVEISLTSAGFEVDVNGVKAYDKTILSNAATGVGSITDYYNLLYWLTNTADTVYFGKGSWWAAEGYDEALCTISNVYFYAYLMRPDTAATHTYSENYNSATTVADYWTSTNLQTGLAFVNKRDTQKQYAQFTVASQSGTRGAVSVFPSAGQVTGKYTVMTDVNLSAANATGYENQFVITNSARAYTSNNINSGVASGYIVKLSTTASSTTWSINGGQGTVTIPKSTWVNIKAFVDTSAGTAVLKITNKATGVVLYSGTVTISGTGTLQGLYFMGGRTSSVQMVDNIIVDQYVDGSSTSDIDLSSYDSALEAASYAYNGSAKIPAVTVGNGSDTLEEGTDYAVTYSNNINAGTATVTVRGMINYTGVITKTFTIAARNASAFHAALDTSSYNYDGTAKAPVVTVKDGTILVAASNYTVTYTNNTNAGTATAEIAFSGNYTGTVTKTYTIEPKEVSTLTVDFGDSSYTYDGTAKTPEVTVTDGATPLVEGTDYSVTYTDNKNAGTATVTVTGLGNYAGTAAQTFSIAAKSTTALAVSVNTPVVTYDGTAKTPAVTVNDGGITLTEGTDYSISYSNNTNVGTAEITITGEGNYSGIINQTFTIVEKSASTLNIILSETTFTYDGTAKTPSVTVMDGLAILAEGTDYTVDYSSNTEVGTAAVTITGIGNYTGSASETFTIAAIDLAELTVTLNAAAYTYDGTARTPEVLVSDGTTALVRGTDYEVSYADNINAGTAKVTVRGLGHYAGEVTRNFTITADGNTELTVILEASTYTYDGTAKTPGVTVKAGSTTLTAETDYTVAYENNMNVGTATVIITAKGNYAGSVTDTFAITARTASALTVILGTTAYTYDGTAKTPALTVKDGAATLAEGIDYTVSYKNNINVGAATITITGKGNYTGTTAQTFLITAKEVAALTAALEATAYIYDGTAKTPAVTVSDGSTLLTAEADYTVSYRNNVNAGTATVTVTGAGNYTGTMTQTFTITGKSAAAFTVILGTSTYTYDGTAKTPAVSVKDGETVLAAGTDYTVSYSNNTEEGTATVTITGAGNYAGTATQTFAITGKAADTLTVNLGTSVYTYDGTAKTPAVTVSDGSTVLTEEADYTVSYTNNVNAGTATVTVTGEGNYTGIITRTFTITGKAAAALTVILGASSYTYDGTAKTPSVSVRDGAAALVAGTDYTVSYSNNTNVGTATAIITGTGNYAGTTTQAFIITGKAVSALSVTLGTLSYTYDGTAKTPSVTVRDGSVILTEGTGYTLSYKDNINVGTATVTITGTGNYTGTVTQTFAITGKTATALTVILGKATYTYDGTAKTPVVTVKDGTATLAERKDYTVSYKNNTDVGTATVTITGIGNYTGTTKETFTITAKPAAKLTVKLEASAYPYSGKAIKPTVTVKDGSTTLVSGTDYKVSYSNNTNPGEAAVKITGIGNYSGAITKTFKIQLEAPKASLTAGKKSVNVKWGKVPGATGYVVYMASSKTGSYSAVYTANGSTLSYNKKGLTSNKTYYFKVVAFTGSGSTAVYSDASSVVSVKVK
jgi:beta-xylosidase